MADQDDDLLGLARGEVRLEPANPAWEREAERLTGLLHLALGNDAVAIEHVGSTAVPGLVAKPIVDIVVGIGAESHRDALVPVVETAGLIYRGDLGANGGLLFVLEDRPAHRLAHIHLVRHGDAQWINYLAVRQRLRHDAETREAYAGIKRQLATEFPQDRGSYTAGKATFISRLLNPDDQSLAATVRWRMNETDVEPNVSSTGAVRFRRVKPDDVTSVRELHELALRHAGGFIESPEAQMWDRDLDHIPEVYFERGGDFLVGVDGTRIVAMGALRVEQGGRAEVKRMRVHPQYQGRGIGRHMLQLLEARARECGVALVTLDTTPAQVAARSLYISAGYREAYRTHRAGLEFVFMEKFLADDDQTATLPG